MKQSRCHLPLPSIGRSRGNLHAGASGNRYPRWWLDGEKLKLHYLTGSKERRQVWMIEYTGGDGFAHTKPESVFEFPFEVDEQSHPYNVLRDGDFFAATRPEPEDRSTRELQVIVLDLDQLFR